MKPINENDLEQVSAFIDGELSDSERRFFQKRLCNDAELRAYCERAWIASSVLKSQPFQLMPINSAEQICQQCEAPATSFKFPLRLVASLGAFALITGLGFQLMKSTEPLDATIVKAPSPVALPAVVSSTVPNTNNALGEIEQLTHVSTAVKPINSSALPSATKNIQQVAQDNPSQFELNEVTRSKTWPTSNQDMDEYLARHNQMIGSNANNGLISYAQILTETTEFPVEHAGQDSNQDIK
jgi:negative regulator of sigma E activity